MNLTHVWKSNHLFANTQQTLEQVPPPRAPWFCPWCGGGGGSWLGSPTIPHPCCLTRCPSLPHRVMRRAFCSFLEGVESEVSKENQAAHSHKASDNQKGAGLAPPSRSCRTGHWWTRLTRVSLWRRQIVSMYSVLKAENPLWRISLLIQIYSRF